MALRQFPCTTSLISKLLWISNTFNKPAFHVCYSQTWNVTLFPLYLAFIIKKKFFFYSEGRHTGDFSPHVPAAAGIEPGPCQEPQNQSRFLPQVACTQGPKDLGPSLLPPRCTYLWEKLYQKETQCSNPGTPVGAPCIPSSIFTTAKCLSHVLLCRFANSEIARICSRIWEGGARAD